MESNDPARVTHGEIVLHEERFVVEKQRELDHVVVVARDVATTGVAKPVAVLVETLHLRRRATNRSVDYDVAPIVDPQRLVVTLSRERIDVGKRVVVSEEVRLRRQSARETRHVSGMVRRERLVIEEQAFD